MSCGVLRRVVFVLVVVLAFAASGAGGAPASGAGAPLTVGTDRAGPTHVLTAEYEGTYHFEDHQEFQGEKLDSIETFKWDAHGALTVRGDTGAVLSSRFTLVASGRLYLNSTNGGKPIIEDCTFKELAPNQLKAMDSIVSIQPHVIGKLTGFGAAFNMPDTVGYQVSVADKNGNCNMFKGSSMLLSNSATEGTVNNIDGFLQNNLWLRAFGSPAFQVSLGRKLRQPIDVVQTGRNANETAKRSVHGVWTLGGPVGPLTPPPKPPAKKPCVPAPGKGAPLNQAAARDYLRKLENWVEKFGNDLQAKVPNMPRDAILLFAERLDYDPCTGKFYIRDSSSPWGYPIPPPPPPPPPDPPDDDSFAGVDVTSSPDVLSVQSPGKPSAPRSTTIKFTGAGIAALRSGKPLTVTLKGLVRVKGKPPITATTTITLKGRRAAPTARISSVTFNGNQQNPSFVIHGQNLGKRPAPNPSGSPSNKPPLCPVTIQGNAGLDYGTNLFINDNTRSLAAGRYRPSVNELDCIGLIVTKFTPTEVAYRFGSYYEQVYPKYVLTPGDTVEVVVNGATKTVHVKYGATVAS